MDPPIDNADPVEAANESLKNGLRSLAREDWIAEFQLLGRPSNEFVRVVAAAALQRIRELEFYVPMGASRQFPVEHPLTAEEVADAAEHGLTGG